MLITNDSKETADSNQISCLALATSFMLGCAFDSTQLTINDILKREFKRNLRAGNGELFAYEVFDDCGLEFFLFNHRHDQHTHIQIWYTFKDF